MSNRVAPEPSSEKAFFGVAKNFRKTHGEAAFMALATAAFTEADTDGSGSIDKSELRETLKKLGIRLPGQTVTILQHYDKDGNKLPGAPCVQPGQDTTAARESVSRA